MPDVAANLRTLREDIRSVASACGRNAAEIRILAVSKTVEVARIREALGEGQTCFGENRVQEAEPKIRELAPERPSWHLIGPLQANKARRAVELFDVIQTVDRPRIARRLSELALELKEKPLPVFIQVNVGDESQKHGVSGGEAAELAQLVDSLEGLELLGLMSIPPCEEDPEASRPYFREMAGLLGRLNRNRAGPLRQLSMGMSHDYRVAVQEGATLIRVGTALFGRRSR